MGDVIREVAEEAREARPLRLSRRSDLAKAALRLQVPVALSPAGEVWTFHRPMGRQIAMIDDRFGGVDRLQETMKTTADLVELLHILGRNATPPAGAVKGWCQRFPAADDLLDYLDGADLSPERMLGLFALVLGGKEPEEVEAEVTESEVEGGAGNAGEPFLGG